MARASIAVVSDLHAGPENPFAELRTGATSAIRSRFLALGPLGDSLNGLLDETPDAARFLICAGDLSTTCHSDELRRAATFLTSLSEAIRVPDGHRGLVPGNHDIDWNLTTLATSVDGWYDAHRQAKFKAIVQELAPTFIFPTDGVPRTLGGPASPIQLFLLDSPYQDRSDTQPHHGRLGPDQLAALKVLMNGANGTGPKILVLHHHVIPMGRNVDDPDFSLLQDAADLLDAASASDVRVILHGHQHRACLRELSHPGAMALVLGAGSTAVVHGGLPHEALHSLHVVHFDEISGSTVRGRVVTRILSLTEGWLPPLITRDKIEPMRPFGGHVAGATLQEWAVEAIEQCVQQGLVKLNRFLESRPSGEYVSLYDFSIVVQRQVDARADAASFELLQDPAHDSYQLQLR
jgi:hypothetical protein